MSFSKYFTAKRAFIFMIIGLVAFALYLYFFVGASEILEVVQSVSLSDFVVYYSMAIVGMLLVMLLWSASWRSFLGALSIKISWRRAFLFYWLGYFADLIVPVQAVGGEVMRLFLVQRETKADVGALAASAVTNRIISYIVAVAALSAGSLYLIVAASIPAFALNLLLLTWAAALIYLGILLYMAFGNRSAEKIASAMVRVLQALHLRRKGEGLSEKTLKSLVLFQDGFKCFRSHRRFMLKPLVYQTAAFVLNLAVYALVFYAMGFSPLRLSLLLVVYFLASAFQDALGVFSVGGLDILLTSIFVYYSIPAANSSVVSALLRSVIFWFPLVAGYIIAHVMGIRGLLSKRETEAVK